MGVTSLAVMFDGSTASGAERAYKKALNKLTEHLVDADVLGVVELKLTDKNKKIAAAAYEYKAVHRYANDDDEWGEIRFDFSAGTAQIVKLADGDFSRTNVFAKIAIRQILKLSMSELPKKLTIPFELEQEKIRYEANRCGGDASRPYWKPRAKGFHPSGSPAYFPRKWYPNCKNAV